MLAYNIPSNPRARTIVMPPAEADSQATISFHQRWTMVHALLHNMPTSSPKYWMNYLRLWVVIHPMNDNRVMACCKWGCAGAALPTNLMHGYPREEKPCYWCNKPHHTTIKQSEIEICADWGWGCIVFKWGGARCIIPVNFWVETAGHWPPQELRVGDWWGVGGTTSRKKIEWWL